MSNGPVQDPQLSEMQEVSDEEDLPCSQQCSSRDPEFRPLNPPSPSLLEPPPAPRRRAPISRLPNRPADWVHLLPRAFEASQKEDPYSTPTKGPPGAFQASGSVSRRLYPDGLGAEPCLCPSSCAENNWPAWCQRVLDASNSCRPGQPIWHEPTCHLFQLPECGFSQINERDLVGVDFGHGEGDGYVCPFACCEGESDRHLFCKWCHFEVDWNDGTGSHGPSDPSLQMAEANQIKQWSGLQLPTSLEVESHPPITNLKGLRYIPQILNWRWHFKDVTKDMGMSVWYKAQSALHNIWNNGGYEGLPTPRPPPNKVWSPRRGPTYPSYEGDDYGHKERYNAGARRGGVTAYFKTVRKGKNYDVHYSSDSEDEGPTYRQQWSPSFQIQRFERRNNVLKK